MCFSAEASFLTGAALVACGGLTIGRAVRGDRSYLALACLPLLFGVQQISEGMLWLALEADPPVATRGPMLVFLFFAYWFWPVWVPMSAAMIEPNLRRRRLFRICGGLGAALGAVLYLPVLLRPEVLEIAIVHHSIRYANPELFPHETAKVVVRFVYGAIICLPLLSSSVREVRLFGWLILASVVFGFLFVAYAFTSVWCFIAAVISAYIFFVVRAARTTGRAVV